MILLCSTLLHMFYICQELFILFRLEAKILIMIYKDQCGFIPHIPYPNHHDLSDLVSDLYSTHSLCCSNVPVSTFFQHIRHTPL